MISGYRGFHFDGGTPIAGWFRMEHPLKMDELGVPLFQKKHMMDSLRLGVSCELYEKQCAKRKEPN